MGLSTRLEQLPAIQLRVIANNGNGSRSTLRGVVGDPVVATDRARWEPAGSL
jgi:hypothetical protein